MNVGPHADVYADLLKVPADGWALWNPDHEGAVGDCGLLADGSFFKVSTSLVVDLSALTTPSSSSTSFDLPQAYQPYLTPIRLSSRAPTDPTGVCAGELSRASIGMSTLKFPSRCYRESQLASACTSND